MNTSSQENFLEKFKTVYYNLIIYLKDKEAI